jgi:hypothetical protein
MCHGIFVDIVFFIICFKNNLFVIYILQNLKTEILSTICSFYIVYK